VQVGRVAMTGTAYFELSLNHVDFDDVFRRWNDEWLLLSNDGVLQCVAVCCGVLRCVAVCCSVLQCVAVDVNLNHVDFDDVFDDPALE